MFQVKFSYRPVVLIKIHHAYFKLYSETYYRKKILNNLQKDIFRALRRLPNSFCYPNAIEMTTNQQKKLINSMGFSRWVLADRAQDTVVFLR